MLNPPLLRVVEFAAKALLDLLNPEKNPRGYVDVQKQVRGGRWGPWEATALSSLSSAYVGVH